MHFEARPQGLAAISLQFGTELVAAKDGSLAALLGASPGASVTVSIMLELIERCFPQKAAGEWATKLHEIFPAREKVLETDAELYRKINTQNNISLELVEPVGASSLAKNVNDNAAQVD